MTHADSARLRDAVAAVVADSGFDLEDLTVTPAGRRRLVRVVVDGDEGVDLDSVATISTAVSAALDDGIADEVFGEHAYTLEVTSPGVGRPLTLPRHFRRATGRLLSITVADGSVRSARLRRLDGDVLVLLAGKSGVDESRLALADVRRAAVEVEFGEVPPAVAALLAQDAGQEPDDEPDDAEPGDDEEGGAE